MNLMNFCPNINLPQSKALIEKLGLSGFYKYWIENGYAFDDDIADNTLSVADLVLVNKDKFTAYQQEETISSMVYQIQQLRREGMTNVKDIVNEIKSRFSETEEYFREEGLSDPQALDIANNLKDVLDHFSQFMVKVNTELNKAGITISGASVVTEDTSVQTDNETAESSYDTTEGVYQKLNYDDESSFSQSSKDTASGDIKLALSLIPKYVYTNNSISLDTDGDPVTELNHLMLPKFESLDVIWKDLLYSLIDVPIGSKLDYLKTSTNPRHNIVYEEIVSNPDVRIQNEFEVVFSKQQANFVTTNISRPDNSGNKTIAVFDTNRSNANSFLIDNWYSQFLQSGVVNTDTTGDKYVDKESGARLKARFDALIPGMKLDREKTVASITELLNSIGINISTRAFSETVTDESGNSITGTEVILQKLPYFFSRLAGLQTEKTAEDALEYNNPFINDTSSITLLAKLENKANPTLFEDSFVSGDNKSKYSFVNNSYASLKMRKLKTDTNYLLALQKTPYASKSFWLTQLLTNPTFKNNFGMFYLDTIGNSRTNQVNKPFKRMNTKEKEFTRIGLFQNQGRGTDNRSTDIGYFLGLIPSDKTTIPVFKTLKVNVRVDDQLRFNRDTIDVIYDQFISEYNRVKQVQQQNDDPSIQKISGYHGKNSAGNKFIVFRFLNKDLIVNNELIELDDIRLTEIVKPQIENFLAELTTQQLAYWSELGLTPDVIFDKSYANKRGFNNNSVEANMRSFAADYAVNQFIFMMNQTQLISGDPALHGKNDKGPDGKTPTVNIDKTWINFYKRMAKDIAPGLDGNFKNSSFNTIFLEDLKYDSALLNEYNEKVGEIGQAYAGLNPADAQEYTTLQEHLDVMEAYGRLTQEAKEAGDRLLAGGSDISDVKLILQPMKPVYVTDKIEDNIDKMYYIKTSSFPLIPALTSGLEIDKLRLAMEANDIQRAVYESGVKLGLQGDISKISKDGFVKFRELEVKPDQIINLDRGGFRIQQELPYHGGDTHITEGSQSRKMILNNVSDDDTINYNGKDLTGKEAKQLFENLHIEKMNRAFNSFMKEIGFDESLGKITDLSKIEAILKEEATLRNYPINDIYSLQVINDNGRKRFKVPLGFTNSSTRFESILNALVTNRVIRQELPGFSKVQGSAAGFSKIAGFDEVNAIVKSAIIWTDPSDTVLTYTREVDGTLTGADILLPSWFKDTDVNSYIREDGTLDTDRLPKELLTVIGIRIPTQGYNSMMKFVVKGFLPKYMGDLAIVPSEIVAQMGSDFDVDKLFLYRYHYNKDADGNFSRLPLDTSNLSALSDEQLEDGITQMFVDRLSDPKLLDQMLEPNGFGTLPDVAKTVAKLQTGDKAIHTFTTKDQNNIHKLNNDGKAGTGIFSLFSTFNKAAQDAKLSLAEPLKFKNNDGQVVSVGNFYDIYGIDSQRKSSVIAYLQSAAVDNSKEQILGKLNINDQTMGVAGTMAMLGLSEDFIGYYLSQPVLVEYVNRVQQANDIISGEFDNALEANTILELREKYINQAGDEQVILSSKDLLASLEEINPSIQVAVLDNFISIKNIADNIRALQSATSVDTSGLGSSFTSVETRSQQIANILTISNREGYPILNVENLFNNNVIGKATDVLNKSKSIYSQILPQGSIAYQEVVDKIQKSVGLIITDNNLNDIYKNIKSYVLTSPDILGENLDALRQELLYSKNNLAKRWNDYSKTADGKKNSLTARIKSRFAQKKGDANLLTSLNTPASNNAIDIDNSIMYFYDMITNGTEVEKQLANDLVKYYIITGAQFGPTSIGKYISYDVLEKNNFSQKLRDIEDLMRHGSVLDGFIDQYFQNNPTKARSYQLDSNPDSYITKEDPKLTVDGQGMAGYFVSYNQKKNEFKLYKKVGKEPNGFLYRSIPILANTKELIKNYNFINSRLSSAPVEIPVIEVPTTTNESINTTGVVAKYDFGGGTQNVLKSIIDNTRNAYYKNLATDLLTKFNNLGAVKITNDNSRPVNGWYDSRDNTVHINIDLITERFESLSDAKIEEVILHELLHAGTVNSLNKHTNLKSSKSNSQMVSDGDFTKEQVVAINGINGLFEQYKKNYPNQEKLNQFIEINNRRAADPKSITDEEMQFLRDNKAELYPLVNVKEFIAAGLTNESFTNTLKSNNLWTKLVDFISNLLGLNSNDLDALYNSTISLLDTSSPATDISEDITDSQDEVNRLTFIRQRDEFLRAYKKQIGSVITPESLANIKKYADENSKYSNLKIWGWPRGDGKLELRVSRVDPVYDDIADASKTASELFIEKAIAKYQENLKNLLDRQRQLGTNAPLDLSVRIDRLRNKIQELTEKQSVTAVIDAAEEKISDIRESLNNDSITATDLYEDKSYLNMLVTLNSQIEFEEDFRDLEVRLNNVSAEAIKLNRRLYNKSVELLQDVVQSKLAIPFDLKKKIADGLRDVGAAESGFLDYSQSSSEVIQSIGYLIDRAKFDANQQHDSFSAEFTPLLREFKSKYKNFDVLLQKDVNGNKTGFLLNKYSQQFYDKSKGNFKFFNANTVVNYTEDGKALFEEDKARAFDSMTEDQYFAWLRLNSPESFINDWKDGKKPEAKGANKYVDITPISKWIDPNYSNLKALGEDDPALKMYNFIEPILRKTNRKYEQQSNYIPEIQQSTLDYFLSGNVKGGFNNINRALTDSLTVELAGSSNDIDEFTGQPRLFIPVVMFGNKLSAQDKSYDLARIVEAVQYQEYTLTAKREIEPLLNIYYNVVKESKEILTKPNGDEVVLDKAPSRTLDQSNYLIQSYLYNKSRESELISSKKIKGKNISGSKAVDSLINYVRIKGMAFNPFSAIGNVMQGLTSNFITATGGEYFSTSDYFKSFGTMLYSLAGRGTEAKKIGAMIRKFDAFSKANELQFGTSRDIKDTQNALNNLSWFELQERGEYFIQGQTLLSMLYNSKVKVGDKEISYYEGYDENGKWKSEYGEDPLAKTEDMYKYTQKVKSAVIDVHGNYVREIQNKKNWYWRATLIFRTWLPQAITVRFGGETTDLISGKVKKGRYRSYDSFIRDSEGMINLDAVKENIMWLLGSNQSTMSELDKINMRKNIAELALIAAITTLILMLKAAIEDDDDEDKNYTTYVLNSLMRTQNDLTFFMLPSSYQAIMKDPWPLMGVLSDTIDLTKAGFATITGDPVYKSGPRKGKSRLYKELADNFPIMNQIDRNLTYAKKAME